MQQHLFDLVNVRREQTYTLNGVASFPEAETQAYEEIITAKGGIDLQLLGIGENGHIGFNEPLSSLMSRTRLVTLDCATLKQNASFFGGNPDNVPHYALSMGIGTILAARKTVLVATGSAKAESLARAIEGPLSACVPASALQLHPDCLIIADQGAASVLIQYNIIAWQMAHDNELVEL